MKRILWTALLAGSLLSSSGFAAERLGRYDFSYTAESRLRPAQVFDDGRDTYFQFPSGAAVPAIFVQTADGPVLAEPELQAQWVRIKGLHAEFLLRLGLQQSRVLYAGGARLQAASPQFAPRTPPDPPQLPASLPPSLPVAIAPLQVPVPSPVVPAGATRWEVQVADVTLANTLIRWGSQAGYRVRWDAPRHVLIDAPDIFTGTFEAAVEAVLGSAGIGGSSHPLAVCFHPNTPPLARITPQGHTPGDCS